MNLAWFGAKHSNNRVSGLGAGISATSFVRQGIDTTIVEIDSTVYDAAKRFFGLPAPPADRLFIEDARRWVHNVSETVKGGSDTNKRPFDVVVHDCFSGGGVPAHLYTKQFWEDLKNIVSPDAVIAVVRFHGLSSMLHTSNTAPRITQGS